MALYRFVGALLGLAWSNGIQVGVPFAPLVFSKLASVPSRRIDGVTIAQLAQSFPDLAHGLTQLLEYSPSEDVEDVFCRSFEISLSSDTTSSAVNVPLVENGDTLTVTGENRRRYVRLYVDYLANDSVKAPFEAMLAGLRDMLVFPHFVVNSPHDLQSLLCGNEAPPSLSELRQYTAYDDGYSSSHPAIQMFWSIVLDSETFTPELVRQLLIFVTATERLPVGGWRDVTFVIQRNGDDSDRLPTALTCFGRLLLPEYRSRDKMRDRLITAITNCQGFGLV
ncbi:hypothetical protein GQ42DRAFT_141120 [Ramicandelaber brevisporus]|nr:hypothetical protein GQ42DRAFT_141120 [Ramicandelaber brevisporus]